MKKLLIPVMCMLCLLLLACGGVDEMQEARKVFDQYCTASIAGDTEQLVSLTSEHFRNEYAKQPPVTDQDIITMGKAFSGKSQYTVNSMEEKTEGKMLVSTTLAVPDPVKVLQRVEETINPAELQGLNDAQIQNLLARKMTQILNTEEITLVSVDMPVEMIKEDGK